MKELSLSSCRIDKRYDVVEDLGHGSYAEIFVARDVMASEVSAHARVVIKALNVFLQNDLDPDLERTLVENFQNEAIALDRVRHPNVISRLGHGTARDLSGTIFHYLVLEYMPGGDLQRLIRERPPGLKNGLRYLEQVCAGLRHAHDKGVIHRDIKPQNLLLSGDHEIVKIADFGVARVHQADTPITRVGTNVYAPPEHSPLITIKNHGTPARLTPAADIYSLAKTFYTIATGESPRYFTQAPITELPMSVRNEEWAPELKRVLLMATQDDPAARHQSIDEFWKDLAELRRFAEDFETATAVRPKFGAAPQAQVAVGYSPLVPQQARFNTSQELRRKFSPANSPLRIDVERLPRTPAVPPDLRVRVPEPVTIAEAENGGELAPKRMKRRRVLRWALLAAVLLVFAGGLYMTALYFRNSGLISDFIKPFSSKTGTANTDINLRPEPSADNSPIGLVTKNSKVRIIKVQNNWYQVDVLQQGRDPGQPLDSDRGWLYGKYVDIDQ